ncbi:MAG: c-type cytochrome [Neisseriaceae bacterium]|nr:c-type cytochrome [Neisseriaceae bacterium]
MKPLLWPLLAAALLLSACGDDEAEKAAQVEAEAKAKLVTFTPPEESEIPDDEFGKVVKLGRDIFADTPRYAPEFSGNGLSCRNCHIDNGRQHNAAPLWGAQVAYPQYRAKNGHVNTLSERIQGCFMYSMNGTKPPLGSKELIALESFAFWMAKGAPVATKIEGAGFKKYDAPEPPDLKRGAVVYEQKCAVCHGPDGQGQKVDGKYNFPPLWGPDSYNWGAGMHQMKNAAAFIRYNMPLSQGESIGAQEAYDVAYFMNSHERPQDPRFTGDLAETRKKYHDTKDSVYGTEVNGHIMGSKPATFENWGK